MARSQQTLDAAGQWLASARPDINTAFKPVLLVHCAGCQTCCAGCPVTAHQPQATTRIRRRLYRWCRLGCLPTFCLPLSAHVLLICAPRSVVSLCSIHVISATQIRFHSGLRDALDRSRTHHLPAPSIGLRAAQSQLQLLIPSFQTPPCAWPAQSRPLPSTTHSPFSPP